MPEKNWTSIKYGYQAQESKPAPGTEGSHRFMWNHGNTVSIVVYANDLPNKLTSHIKDLPGW
jgi:hypothetical protein